MIRHPSLWLSALIFLSAACSNGGEKNRAVSGRDAAAAAAPGSNATAQASGDCPFPTRNWRVTLGTSPGPEGGRQIAIHGEVDADAQGRYPMLAQQLPKPPEVVLNVDNDPMATPGPPPGWVDMGIGYDYDPAFTHAVVRCAGREIARMPIPRR